MNEKNMDMESMIEMFDKKYGSETLFSFQPREAFITNARATIACTLKELGMRD
jgi:hypothetical protein